MSTSSVKIPREAMVFAAGLGTRMRPITDTIPKPLIEVSGKSLLEDALDNLASVGVQKAVVNTHYKGEMIVQKLKNRTAPKIIFSPEEEILETGGGLMRALSHFEGDTLFVVNSDVLVIHGEENAFRRLAYAWDDSQMDILLLIYPRDYTMGYEGLGDYFIDSKGRLTRRIDNKIAPYMYAGSQILHRRILQGLIEKKFSLREVFDAAQQQGRLYGLVHTGDWYHLSTPEDLQMVRDELENVPATLIG